MNFFEMGRNDPRMARRQVASRGLYKLHSLAFYEREYSQSLEFSNKLILPGSMVELISEGMDSALLFKVSHNSTHRYTHCGVDQFSSPRQDTVYAPYSVLESLNSGEGDIVTLEKVTLVKGSKIRLQAQSTDFLQIENPKMVLEQALIHNYFCLTLGDTMYFQHLGKKYAMNVLDLQPDEAVCLLDTDLTVDFAAPLGYVDPEDHQSNPWDQFDEDEKANTEVLQLTSNPFSNAGAGQKVKNGSYNLIMNGGGKSPILKPKADDITEFFVDYDGAHYTIKFLTDHEAQFWGKKYSNNKK
ncbi:hypothetical protein PCE1_002066 [Barthelona sp. PCE]